jgi:hypothetical protein
MISNKIVNGIETWQVNAPFSLRTKRNAIYNMLKDLETQQENNPELEYGVIVIGYNKKPSPVPNEQAKEGKQ